MKKTILSLMMIFSCIASSHVMASIANALEFQEGDSLHVCVSGDLTAQLQRDNGQHMNLPRPFKVGGQFGLISATPEEGITLRNTNSSLQTENAKLFVFAGVIKILFLWEVNNGHVPYVEYITQGSNQTPCVEGAPRTAEYTFNNDHLPFQVTEITAPQPQEEAPAPEVVPAADPVLPNNATPQSGGCSMTTTLGGFNYALSTFFALVLGAHALLRFRRK